MMTKNSRPSRRPFKLPLLLALLSLLLLAGVVSATVVMNGDGPHTTKQGKAVPYQAPHTNNVLQGPALNSNATNGGSIDSVSTKKPVVRPASGGCGVSYHL